jgi:SPP1 family predicted phage head-tail adaptor
VSLGVAPSGVIDRFGMDIEIVELTQTGTDQYGDPQYSETTTDAKGRVERSSEDETVQAGGSQVSVDAEIYVDDDLSVTWKTVEDEEPTEINTQGKTYQVISTDEQNNGIIRLFCKGK